MCFYLEGFATTPNHIRPLVKWASADQLVPVISRTGNRPHVNNLAPSQSLRCDCALIVSEGGVTVAAAAAAATATTNNMQHISVSWRRSPTSLCGQQYAQSNFTTWMSRFPLDPSAARTEKRLRDQVKERYELRLATRERELDVEWASVWAGLAGEQSKSTGPLRFGRKKDESEWGPGVEKNKTEAWSDVEKEHSGKKDWRR